MLVIIYPVFSPHPPLKAPFWGLFLWRDKGVGEELTVRELGEQKRTTPLGGPNIYEDKKFVLSNLSSLSFISKKSLNAI